MLEGHLLFKSKQNRRPLIELHHKLCIGVLARFFISVFKCSCVPWIGSQLWLWIRKRQAEEGSSSWKVKVSLFKLATLLILLWLFSVDHKKGKDRQRSAGSKLLHFFWYSYQSQQYILGNFEHHVRVYSLAAPIFEDLDDWDTGYVLMWTQIIKRSWTKNVNLSFASPS